MKKELNNNGMTLVELLITFSLLMVVVVGMFNLILDIKLDMDDKQIVKSFSDYSSYYVSTINLDLVKNQPYKIIIKESELSASCMTSKGETCNGSIDKYTYFCNASGECVEAQDTDHPLDKSSEKFSKMCARIYPCAIAAYKSKGDQPIKYMAISINVPDFSGENTVVSVPAPEPGQTTQTTEKPLNKSDYGIGINYYRYRGVTPKGVYEQIPNQDYIYLSNFEPTISFGSGGEDESESGSVNSNSFVIDFPLYKTGSKTNYGFKIVYPFVKQ